MNELPDSIRVPLDELDADAGYLVGRCAIDPDSPSAQMVIDKVRVQCARIRAAVIAELKERS